MLDEAAKVGPVVVCSSWGKDSVALCDLACERWGRATIMHLASPYRLPGWERVAEHFAARANVVEVPAARTLDEYVAWCRDIGLPHERRRAAQARVVGEIKRDRGSEWAREHGFVGQVLGLRVAEHGPRAIVLRQRGPLYQIVDGSWRVCPLMRWQDRDVWAHIASRGLPYHALYDRETHGQTRESLRNLGWLSTDGAERGRLVWLRAHYPEQYAMLAREFPQVRLIS